MKALDLFCGLKGWSTPFLERGHDVRTLDLDPRFSPTYVADILSWDESELRGWRPDIILASPPCEGFSVMNIGKNWNHDHTPKSLRASLALHILRRTVQIIDALAPAFFIIENPRAKMRRMALLDRFERRTVTYCHYGEQRMKPTDLFGGFPPPLVLAWPCKNGDLCHVRAPRGSRTGTQGMERILSAKIPYALALDVCRAAETALELDEERVRLLAAANAAAPQLPSGTHESHGSLVI